MKLNPYLAFKGHCEEAFKFYQQRLGGTIQIDDTAEAERIFKSLSEGGTVTLPLQQTFWAPRFGMFVDRFGIPWMVNCEQPA